MIRPLLLICFGFVLLLTVQPGARAVGGIWEDPDFIDRFTATYGVRGDQEPEVSRDEQNLLREVAARMPDNPEEAATILQRELTDDSSAALDFTLGNLRFQLGEYPEAAAHYRAAISKFPDFLRAHKNLGLVLARQGEFRDALPALSRALTLGSADGDTYGLIGYAHMQRDHWVSSEAAYRQALLFEPENPNWQIGLARALQEQERHHEANAILSELTSRFPDRPNYWLYQSNTYLQLGKPLDAASNIELARRMNSATHDSLLLLGDIYVNEDLPGPAVDAYEEAAAAAGSLPVQRGLRAAGRLTQRGHHSEAERLVSLLDADSPQEMRPTDRVTLLRLQGQLAMERGDDEDARRLFENALEINPLDGATLIALANLVAPGDLEHAEILLERAASRGETAAEANRRRGELLVQESRYDEALEFLRQANEIQPRESLQRYIDRVERLTSPPGNAAPPRQ